ncbi:hypothetical protein MFIFM68171_06607 [Madurella fahalii]|uniref:BTB domain-containing protein n=1 Tax=Madurella fahalii TaxID=1157608 RepID=A0ABQ0GF57_9PEZI
MHSLLGANRTAHLPNASWLHKALGRSSAASAPFHNFPARSARPHQIASSKLFRFSVGPDRREFTVHSAIVAPQSPVLNTLINGNFSEASEGHATLESVDEQTFVSFIQYAYTGDYRDRWPQRTGAPAEASACNVPQAGPTRVDDPEPMEEPMGEPAIEPPAVKKGPYKCGYCGQRLREGRDLLLWEAFRTAVNRRYSAFRPTPSMDATEDYTDVFISYARVYVFADCYQIPELMGLTLEKLGQTLVAFKLYDERVDDVIKLLKYCFGNPTPDTLKSLLVVYTPCKIEQISKSENFNQILAEHGELSARLVGELIKRLD